jgi:hypothetical protein
LGTRDPLTHIFENVWQIKDLSLVFLEVWQMQGSEAKNSEVWQGKGLSDFWCWETAVEQSQFRIPISCTEVHQRKN